jgi:hypothetical protein
MADMDESAARRRLIGMPHSRLSVYQEPSLVAVYFSRYLQRLFRGELPDYFFRVSIQDFDDVLSTALVHQELQLRCNRGRLTLHCVYQRF